MESNLFAAYVKSVCKTFGVIQDSVDRSLEPGFDISADQIACEKEKEQSGDERERNEKKEKLGFETGSKDFSFSLQVEFCQIPPQDKKKDEKHQKNDDLEEGQEYIGE
jgi:hypothetical protein